MLGHGTFQFVVFALISIVFPDTVFALKGQYDFVEAHRSI
jgi:hypothetical protein